MDLGLTGRVALILGASQGLGAASAHALAAEGVHVVVAARRRDVLDAVVAEIVAAGGSAEAIICDLGDSDSRQSVMDWIANAPRLDVLVANSGGPKPGAAPGIASDTWRSEFESMVVGLIEIIDASVAKMRTSGFGRIIAIGSSGMSIPIPHLAVSNTLRSALGGYMKSLAEQVASAGITCNMVLPGRIETDRTQQIDALNAQKMGVSVAEVQAKSAATIPAGRYGQPQELASVVAFLASEQAAYVTGSHLRVDGGFIRNMHT
ncbi:MAG: SDR family oxidoreductase [Litorivicinaceae bacterium]|jgi:3-oxoacyl-[acyl-carrier protein] reductase|nr:SDR family oxidoreductase [Litorivicinaceae bacterium]MDP5344120.1 SDR family oxidoreductase [Litorivicinaceae bacterium]